MCGIAGIVRFGEKPILEEQISLLLTGNEHRGNDATGIAISQADGSINVFKKDIPAWQFVTDDEYYTFIEEHLKPDSWGVILHARSATQGKPEKNENNHPLSCGLSAVVHNGMIRNDESLFKELKLKRTAETDSDIIRGIIDEYGFTEKCIKMLNRIDGGVGAAAFSTKYPKKMLLLRSGNPIVLGSTADFLFFSSEKNTLHRAMKPWLKRFNIFFQVQQTGAAFAPMADDTAWLIGLEGQEAHWEFKSLLGTYSSPNRNTYSKYKNKKLKVLADADKVEKEDAWCPKCKKIWTIPKGGVAKLFRCNPKEGGCNRTLEEMPYKKGTIVSVPGVGNKYVGGSEGNGGCKYCLEGIELTQTGDYHKLSDGGLVWCTRDKKRKT